VKQTVLLEADSMTAIAEGIADDPSGPRLLMLGPPVLEHAQGSLPFASERRFQLLSLLAHQSDWMSRERIATLLWPELSAERARRNLRKVLFGLRELPGLHGLEDHNGALRWAPRSDLQAFESAVARGDLAAAIAQWRGEPWDGMDGVGGAGFDEWLGHERHRLRARWRDTLLQLCDRASDPAQQAQWAGQLLAHDPLDERAVQIRMRACALAGRASEAVRIFEPFAAALAQSVGIEPSMSTRALLPAAACMPAAPAAEADAEFIGRHAEERELVALLSTNERRWITLVGPGGIGKSSFLLKALPALAANFADGAVFVPLEDLAEPGQVGLRLAQRLGLALHGDDDPMLQVQRALAGSRRLLALDNLEHVLGAVHALEGLLQACRDVVVVATSRARAGVAGEWTMPLDGLPYPEPEDADRAEGFDAVKLFVRRALQSEPRFKLADEREAVVQLCAFVEGMPLAIELSAVWTRHFSAEEILRDLKSGGEMLDEPLAGRTPRQQSIAATFEHSWRLLADAERDALMRMAIFRGGFTRDAARLVADASLGVLAALIDKSLVRQESVGGKPRFSLHPLLHQFVRARLDQHPVVRETAQRAHAVFYCRLLSRLPPGRAPSRSECYAEIAADDQNVSLAWSQAVAQSRVDLIDGGLRAFVLHCDYMSRHHAGLESLRLAEPVVAGSPHELARLRCWRALLQFNGGQWKQGCESLRAALRVLRRGGDLRTLFQCLYGLGIIHSNLGDNRRAESLFNDALGRARGIGDGHAAAMALRGLAEVAMSQGQYELSIGYLSESIELRQANGGVAGDVRAHLADVQRFAGRPADAIATLNRALSELPANAPMFERGMILLGLGQAWFDLGEDDRAEDLASQALQSMPADVAGHHATTEGLRSRIACRRGEPARALASLQAAARIALRLGADPPILEVAVCWAEYLCCEGELPAARAVLAMIQGHAAARRPDQDKASRLLAALRGRMPASQWRLQGEEARALDPKDVLADLLAVQVKPVASEDLSRTPGTAVVSHFRAPLRAQLRRA
jgi:predicted ATPase/DNA-binding SARP family transcriptional activator